MSCSLQLQAELRKLQSAEIKLRDDPGGRFLNGFLAIFLKKTYLKSIVLQKREGVILPGIIFKLTEVRLPEVHY
jgi:hypothetical protein